MSVTIMKRVFRIKKGDKTIDCPDPNPRFSIDEAKNFYLETYPELISASGHETKVEGDTQVIQFTTTFKPKG